MYATYIAHAHIYMYLEMLSFNKISLSSKTRTSKQSNSIVSVSVLQCPCIVQPPCTCIDKHHTLLTIEHFIKLSWGRTLEEVGHSAGLHTHTHTQIEDKVSKPVTDNDDMIATHIIHVH